MESETLWRTFIADPSPENFERYYAGLRREGKLEFIIPNFLFKYDYWKYFHNNKVYYNLLSPSEVSRPSISRGVEGGVVADRRDGSWMFYCMHESDIFIRSLAKYPQFTTDYVNAFINDLFLVELKAYRIGRGRLEYLALAKSATKESF